MADKAIVVGSGPGGSTAAMVLAEAGFDVVIIEKGNNYFRDLTSPTPKTLFSNDELKSAGRAFEDPDVEAEPRTYRRHASDAEPLATGFVNQLPTTVGGGTVHWDAKTPRFWDIDFSKLSMLGPVPDADIQDWPFDYAEIAPFYDEVERLIGVAGDRDSLPELLKRHAPRANQFVMPPGPPQYSSVLISQGASLLGLHPYPVPMAINSQTYDGRPACNDCGFCSRYGCPIHARVGALAPLRRALIAGAELRANTFVERIVHDGKRASGVTTIDAAGRRRTESADVVVLAGSAIESARMGLLSAFPDPNKLIGRFMMFHWFTSGFGASLKERYHAWRGRSTSHAVDDFSDPDFPGARLVAQAAGLPYFRGGVLELGGTQDPISEANTYRGLMPLLSPGKGFGRPFKQLMRASLLRDRLMGIEMVGEDLAQATNFVDLDPTLKDFRGLPVARVTYHPHNHEITAQRFYIPLIMALLKAAGADVTAAVPTMSSDAFPVGGGGDVPSNYHVMGGMRMSADPTKGVTNAHGRVHGLDNVLVADGSVFVGSGSHNPTLTIMATALRNTRALVSASGSQVGGVKVTHPEDLPATGAGSHAAEGGALIATAGALASTLRRRAREGDPA
jgi:choline dehydrogenase-like flavoprotein